MKLHPCNSRIVCKILQNEEVTKSGLYLARIKEDRPVLFAEVTAVSDDTTGQAVASQVVCPYNVGDTVLIDPTLCHYTGWLADELMIVPFHQILATVELEEGDAEMAEAFEGDNPSDPKIIGLNN